MSLLSFGASVGWLAVLTGVVGTYVQRRRVTTNGAAGVSLATWTLFAFMGCFWITYGVVAHSAQVVAGSVLCLPIQLSIVVRLRPGVRWGVVARAFALFFACCVVPTAMLGWSGGVYGTGVAMTINRLPQLIELVRNADAGGVAAGTWYLAVFGSMCWVLYYAGAHLWAPLIATAVAGVASLAIALLATWRHARPVPQWTLDEVYAV